MQNLRNVYFILTLVAIILIASSEKVTSQSSLLASEGDQLNSNTGDAYSKRFSAGFYILGGLQFFEDGFIENSLKQSGLPDEMGYGYGIGIGGSIHLARNVISIEFNGGVSKSLSLGIAHDIKLRKVLGSFNLWYQREFIPFSEKQNIKLLPGLAVGYVPKAGLNIDWVDASGQEWGRRLLESKGVQYIVGFQIDYKMESEPKGHRPAIMNILLRYSYAIGKYDNITLDTSDKEPYLDIFKDGNRELDFSGHAIELGFGLQWF